MKKRAQGLSMTTIVVAALALLVLVVLALVFTGRMGNFSTGVKEVADCKQACTAAGFNGEPETCTTDSQNKLPGIKDQSGNTCCCT